MNQLIQSRHLRDIATANVSDDKLSRDRGVLQIVSQNKKFSFKFHVGGYFIAHPGSLLSW